MKQWGPTHDGSPRFKVAVRLELRSLTMVKCVNNLEVCAAVEIHDQVAEVA